MPCSRGCCDSPAEHFRSIAISNKAAREGGKTTVDVHDNHVVEVKESWNDRQDVTVKPKTVQMKTVTIQ